MHLQSTRIPLLPGITQDPAKLRAAARKELLQGNYSTVKIVESAVESVEKLSDGTFKATDAAGSDYIGNKLVLATGVTDILPDLPGFAECWGKQIYHCMFCHGYEDTGAKSAGLLAIPPMNKDISFGHGCMARQFAASLTFYTNANQQLASELQALITPEAAMNVDDRPIARLEPTAGGGITLHFTDGSSAHKAFLAYQPKVQANVGMAQKLGLDISPTGADIKVNGPFNDTSVPGCFAVGDVSTQVKALAVAVGSGSIAGPAIVKQIIQEGKGLTLSYGRVAA